MARRRIGPWYRLAVIVLKPPLLGLTRKNWRGAENLPRSGGFVVVVNHISHVDPLLFGHFMYDNGYLPRFLAKESMFRAPVIGPVMKGAQQIPVFRETADAAASYSAAVEAIQRGECIAIHPEGTITRDPGLWPMRFKTGAARIALTAGCPVIPVAQWGAQDILAPYAHKVHLFPRHDSYVWAGPAVDLSPWQGRELTPEVLDAATEAITAATTELLAEIRHEAPPAVRYDPRNDDRRIGNPHKREHS